MAWFGTSLLVVIMAIGILLPALAMAEQSLEFRIIEDMQNEVATGNACCSAIAEYKTSKPGSKLRFGYGEPAKWVKLENVPGGGILRFNPVLDTITLYTRSGADDGWDAAITGDLVASDDKALLSPFMAFPLPVDVDVNAIYARIEQGAAVSVTADHWSTAEFHLMQERDRTVRMFLIGFVCSIILYNLVMSFLVADLTFAANALTIVSMGVCALYLSGYGVIHVWPSWFAATNWIFCAAIASAVCFGAIFTSLFLKLWGSSLQTFWPLVIGPAMAILCFATALFLNLGPGKLELAMLASAMTFLICMSFIVARLAIRGNAEARILMFPLLFAVVPGLIMVALDKISGIDPFGLRGNYMEVTLATEAVMFSLALASRIRIAEMAASQAAVQLMEARDRNAATVLAAQDNERKRLATEIHDNIGQELLVMVGRVKQFAALRRKSGASDLFAELVTGLSSVLHEMRRISREMHPSSIEHLGLAATISGIVEQFQKATATNFTTNLSVHEDRIDPQAQIHIVRIVQECLSNVTRHSGASDCEVDISHDDRSLRIVVEDNGVGLPSATDDTSPVSGLGMISIEERVRSMSGTWSVNTAATGGTRIVVSIPASGLADMQGDKS